MLKIECWQPGARCFNTLAALLVSAMLGACAVGGGTGGGEMMPEKSAPAAKAQPRARPVWNAAHGGVDKSHDAEFLLLRETVAPKFKTLAFRDAVTGKTMAYSLFVPKDYAPGKRYPLVLFMADASTTGKGVAAPLMQGVGALVWASEESQAKHPGFVLVPAFAGPENVTNDQWVVSDEADIVLRLLRRVVAEYGIDANRLYTTGQSMGGMISFHFNARYPDLFAASLFVGSQWDVKALAPLARQKFFYVISAADPKASVGMRELGEMLRDKGVAFGDAEFSARLPQVEQERRVRALLGEGHDINFIRFTARTVAPDSQAAWRGAEHMYSFDPAYRLESVRDWLFQQKKTPGALSHVRQGRR